MPSCNVTSSYEGLPICCAGGKGTLLGGGSPFPGVDEAPVPLLAVIYLVLLLWCFSGVGMAADAFMTAIETITSQERTLVHRDVQGVERRFRARVWNATIANLSLMALGSSAPEILLSLIELLSNDYYSGELGPSTIVGSAAFNMLVIIAVCVVAIPANDARRIAAPKVYAVTALSSTFAYAWLVLILSMHTPNIIDLPEATLTFLFFPLLLATAVIPSHRPPHRPPSAPPRASSCAAMRAPVNCALIRSLLSPLSPLSSTSPTSGTIKHGALPTHSSAPSAAGARPQLRRPRRCPWRCCSPSRAPTARPRAARTFCVCSSS
jgi:hypothetical protein